MVCANVCCKPGGQTKFLAGNLYIINTHGFFLGVSSLLPAYLTVLDLYMLDSTDSPVIIFLNLRGWSVFWVDTWHMGGE